MSTKREIITSFRKKLQEVGADTGYTNQFLYVTLMEQAKWLIRREITAGRIYKNTAFFQYLKCQDVIETSLIDPCCPIKTNCKIYRTKEKLPEMWLDEDGPVMKIVTSMDGSTSFDITTPTTWQNKKDDPYQQMSKQMYSFFADGYLWFPEHNPHKINILGFWVDDITDRNGCSEKQECTKFLDTLFPLPGWIEAEMMAKALQLLIPSKQSPEDENINKNTNIKN